MYRIVSCFKDDHALSSILIALTVCLLGVACSLFVLNRGTSVSSSRTKYFWVLSSGAIAGLTVWATHFVAMLGYKPGFEVVFNGTATAQSALISISGFCIVVSLLVNARTLRQRLVCALLAELTVATMHYHGMVALKSSAFIQYDPKYVALSVIVSLFFFSLSYGKTITRMNVRQNVMPLVYFLLAIVSLHFIGASAMTVLPLKGMSAAAGWTINSQGLTLSISVALTIVVFMFFAAASVDLKLAKLRSNERRKLALLSNAAVEGLLVVGKDGRILQTNEAATTMFMKSEAEICNTQITALLPATVATSTDTTQNSDFGEHTVSLPDGKEMQVDISKRSYEDKDASFTVFCVRDLTNRIAQEAEIRKLAYTDYLTNLSNRAAFHLAVNQALVSAHGTSSSVGMFLIDLDGFKEINDQLGHGVGDRVLQIAARTIQATVGKDAMVARLGGDEFAVLFETAETPENLRVIAQDCLNALGKSHNFGERSLSIAASIGIAISNEHAQNTSNLIRAADRALYAAKDAAPGKKAHLYSNALHKEHEYARKLEYDLRLATENKAFELHYQPKVCATTREIISYEALIRWHREGEGYLSPMVFIPLAEQSDLINKIGAWTIHTACKHACSWPGETGVSVNLSGRQFLDPDLVSIVKEALKASGLKPSRLELEITETALVQNTQTAGRVLAELKEIGIKIALDDFGTGYSSMSYVQQFPFDRIKIDRSFISEVGNDKKASSIIETIIFLGNSLSIPTVAEGVETEDQANYLSSLACEELQGFLIAKPMPFEQTLARASQSDEPLVSESAA